MLMVQAAAANFLSMWWVLDSSQSLVLRFDADVRRSLQNAGVPRCRPLAAGR